MNNTGSLFITSEELGISFSQYYNLGKALSISKDTMRYLRKWDLTRQIKCNSCGRYFSPRLRGPSSMKCIICKQLWRKEYKRYHERKRININPNSFRKSFVVYTGSYIF